MATNEIQGSTVLAEFSVDGATNWKTMVCLTSQTVDGTVSESTTDTQCGPIIAIGTPTWTLTGDAVVNASQAGTEVTYEDVAAWFNAKTKVFARTQNPVMTVPSVAVGASFFHYTQGYFTNVNLTADVTDVVKFSYTFKGVGIMDLTV